MNSAGNWLLRSEVLYNRTNIKVGFDYTSVVNGPKDHLKLDQILVPLELVYVKNKFSVFLGLINNFNFETQMKEFANDYFESVGTYNFREDANSTLYKTDYVDKGYTIQYVAGIEISGTKGTSFGIEFIDYFGYKNYYAKYSDYDNNIQQISSSALNFYMTFKLNGE